MRIGEVPMRCGSCESVFCLDDCDIDDPFGDGSIGCPISDCGGLMHEETSTKAEETRENS